MEISEDLQRIQSYHEKTISYYNSSDPDAALWHARKTAEAICRQIFEQKISMNVGNLTLDKFIEQLVKNQLLPMHIVNPLRTIQGYGNFGTHDQGKDSDVITSEYVRPCLYALAELVKWYFSDYHSVSIKILDITEKKDDSGNKTVKQSVRDAVQEITKGDTNYIFTPKEVAEFISNNYMEVHRNAVIPKLISDCVNHPSREKYPKGEDRYRFVEKGKFRLYDPDKK